MREGTPEDELVPNREPNDPVEPVESAVPAVPETEEPVYPVDRLKARINRSLGERPVMVYLVLIAGAATLLLLLAIVWISATGNNSEDRPICTAISADEAGAAILAGQVERINILVDSEDPLQSLTGLVLDYVDGTCRQPAQGADVRNDLYRILGVVEIYNNFGEQRVRLNYQRQEIQDDLLFTATPTPSPTLLPTDTPTATPTLQATETSTASPEPSPTATTPPATQTVRAVSASPVPHTPTVGPTITLTVTRSPTATT
jgi:hypothetical protein